MQRENLLIRRTEINLRLMRFLTYASWATLLILTTAITKNEIWLFFYFLLSKYNTQNGRLSDCVFNEFISKLQVYTTQKC